MLACGLSPGRRRHRRAQALIDAAFSVMILNIGLAVTRRCGMKPACFMQLDDACRDIRSSVRDESGQGLRKIKTLSGYGRHDARHTGCETVQNLAFDTRTIAQRGDGQPYAILPVCQIGNIADDLNIRSNSQTRDAVWHLRSGNHAGDVGSGFPDQGEDGFDQPDGCIDIWSMRKISDERDAVTVVKTWHASPCRNVPGHLMNIDA